MNRKLFVLPVMGAMLLIGINLFANSVDYATAQSASFIQMASRQASTDAADSLAYNPAGIALMAPGLYLSINEQYYFMHYSESIKGTGIDETYGDNRPIPIYPNVYGVYNMGKVGDGNLAFGLKAGVIGGGGFLDWNNGTTATGYSAVGVANLLTSKGYTTSLTSTDIKQKVSSQYYGFGGSVAYSLFNDRVSLSAGGQYIYASKSAETTGYNYYTTTGLGAWNTYIDSKFTCDANGYNLIFGVDVRPVEKLTLAVSYETEANLKFKHKQDKNTVIVSPTAAATALNAAPLYLDKALASKLNKDGLEANYNLPAIVRMGAEYQFTPEFTMSIGGELFFVNDMNYAGVEEGFQKLGWEANAGATYAVIPSLLKIAAGVTVADVGTTQELFDSTTEISQMGVNDWSTHILMLSCGFTYTIIKDMDLVVGYAHLITVDGKEKGTTADGYEVSYYRGVDNIAVAVNYKVF